jgi:hypothetical protein
VPCLGAASPETGSFFEHRLLTPLTFLQSLLESIKTLP